MRSRDLIWIIYLCAFADSLVSQFFNPAQTAIIPTLVEEKDLLPANSLNAMSQELTRLIGLALGGLLFGLFGISSVITLDIISFFFSAALVSLIVMPIRLAPAGSQELSMPMSGIGSTVTRSLVKVWQEWRAGMGLVRKEQLVSAIFIIFGIAIDAVYRQAMLHLRAWVEDSIQPATN